MKRKLKFEDYANCLKAAQIKNKINYFEKKNDLESLKENYEDFIKHQ